MVDFEDRADRLEVVSNDYLTLTDGDRTLTMTFSKSVAGKLVVTIDGVIDGTPVNSASFMSDLETEKLTDYLIDNFL